MQRLLTAALVLFAAACAGAPRGPAPLDPVGVFEFQTEVDGQPVTGTIEVTGQPGAYGGRVRSSMGHDLPISMVTVSGNEMTVESSLEGQTLAMRMTFTGNEFTGGWTVADDAGTLTGRRRP